MTKNVVIIAVLCCVAFVEDGRAAIVRDTRSTNDASTMTDDLGHVHFGTPYDMDTEGNIYAHCQMEPNPSYSGSHDVHGFVDLRQKTPDGDLEVKIDVHGFESGAGHQHSFHVHELGNLHDGCASLGGHFNPHSMPHSGPEATSSHPGDWGNLACDEAGTTKTTFTDGFAELYGPHSIIGRSIVIHASDDDLEEGGDEGSAPYAGTRIACCVIGRSNADHWSHTEHPLPAGASHMSHGSHGSHDHTGN